MRAFIMFVFGKGDCKAEPECEFARHAQIRERILTYTIYTMYIPVIMGSMVVRHAAAIALLSHAALTCKNTEWMRVCVCVSRRRLCC